MSQQPKLSNFVSGIDQFLNEFDREHPKLSASQQKEVTKYERIYQLRDTEERPVAVTSKLWKGF